MNALHANEVRDVVIIGAGLSGLSAAQALRSRGIDALVLEKEERIAVPWRNRHPQLHLNTHRRLSSLPGYALLRSGPAFPSRNEVIGYLERYAVVTQADIRFNVAVNNLRPIGDDWELQTTIGTIRAGNIVVATGKENQPAIPDWPGRNTWRGQLIHSAEFGDVSAYAGKHVLVVGAGNSGTDVLNHLARVPTRSLTVSIRHGSVVVPAWLLGFPVQLGSPVMDRLPAWVIDRLLAATERLAFGNLRRFGFPDRKGGATRLFGEGVSPAVDQGFVAALKAGRADVVNAVSHFEDDAVILTDGTELKPEIVIAATGYRTGLQPIVGHLGVLDQWGMPKMAANGAASGAPGLWFAGMAPRLPGYFTAARRNSGPMADAIGNRLEARYAALSPVFGMASRSSRAVSPAE